MLRQYALVSDWKQGALPGYNDAPPLFMAQQQLERGKPNFILSFDSRQAVDTAQHAALRLILRHLSMPPAVMDLPLFLHAAARLRIVTAHGLGQPVHMQSGDRQGNLESSLLYVLLLQPLLRAREHRLRPPGGSKRGLIQAYIDDLLVVAHTLQDFAEGIEAVAAYLKMMGMELNPRNCAIATRMASLACTCAPALTCQTPGTGGRQRTPSPTWGSSYSRTGSSPSSTSTGCAWRQCTTDARTQSSRPR